MLTSPITLTPFARRYRRDLMRLLQEHYRQHLHLDWSTVDEWLDEPDVPILLAWRDTELCGALAVSPPLGRTAWIRLVVIHDSDDPDMLLAEMWRLVRAQLSAQGVRVVGVLLLHPWLSSHLAQLGFSYRENIVTLMRRGGRDSFEGSTRPNPYLAIRHGDLRELPVVEAIDHAAFDPLWQMSRQSIRQAVRSSASFAVASLNDQPVGYQISTLYRDGGHLARLATLPEAQGRGVGRALIQDLIEGFARRGITQITVNTQETNQASRHVYERCGFSLTGLDMPVWSIDLDDPGRAF